MTRKDFMIRLRETLQKHGDSASFPHLDGCIRIATEDQLFCPITYVCYRETGERYCVASWRGAVRRLQLRSSTANQIAAAADDLTKKSVRLELLLACDLPQRE